MENEHLHYLDTYKDTFHSYFGKKKPFFTIILNQLTLR